MRFRFLIVMLLVSFLAISSYAQNTNYIAVVSQRFEGGEMIYRRDNGDIFIISNVSGRWWIFQSNSYGQLSINQAAAPNNRISPINGFGRIWANNAQLRQELGWAVLPEIAPPPVPAAAPGRGGRPQRFGRRRPAAVAA
jgi:hypothetical protein